MKPLLWIVIKYLFIFLTSTYSLVKDLQNDILCIYKMQLTGNKNPTVTKKKQKQKQKYETDHSHTASKKKSYHKNKSCSVFGYVIQKALHKPTKCKESELNSPTEKDLLLLLKTLNDLTLEGKIRFEDALTKEVVHIEKQYARESIKRLSRVLENVGNKTDHFILSLLRTFAPILLKLNGGIFDLSTVTKLIRNYSNQLKEQENKKPNKKIKTLIWTKNTRHFTPEKRGSELLKCPECSSNIIEKFSISDRDYGPLLKKGQEKLINVARAIIPPQGFTRLASFKRFYQEKFIKLKTKDEKQVETLQHSIRRDLSLDTKMGAMNSLIKAIQSNGNKILDKEYSEALLDEYVDFQTKIPNIRQRVKRILNLNKPDNELSEEEARKVNNFTAISEVIMQNNNMIKEIGLLPTDLIKEYGKLFNLKLYFFSKEEDLIKALRTIIGGDKHIDKSVIITPLIFWANLKNHSGMHYLNVLHCFDDGTYLVEDTDGKRYKPSVRYKINLVKLMKVNIKKGIQPFIKDFKGLFDSALGKGSTDKILDALEKSIQEKMGSPKAQYCFIVADPNNVVHYN